MGSEFERIRELGRRFRAADAPFEVGIGDDAAVLAAGGGKLVVSVDCAVDGVHFRRQWLSWQQVGYRAVTAALSDLAAMGARPTGLILSLVLPPDFSDESLWALADGIQEAAAEHACPVAGGNLSSGGELSIHTTVLGGCERPITRSAATPGETLFVTGTVGGAALGLSALLAGCPEQAPAFAARWRRPAARIAQGLALQGQASAAVDLSDGLWPDLCHLCQASGVGAELRTGQLPLQDGFVATATRLGADWLRTALGGGEQYELLFSAPQAPAGVEATAIGRIVTGPVRALDPSGAQIDTHGLGFSHFQG